MTTHVARSAAELARLQLIRTAATGVLAQANQQPKLIVQLLSR